LIQYEPSVLLSREEDQETEPQKEGEAGAMVQHWILRLVLKSGSVSENSKAADLLNSLLSKMLTYAWSVRSRGKYSADSFARLRITSALLKLERLEESNVDKDSASVKAVVNEFESAIQKWPKGIIRLLVQIGSIWLLDSSAKLMLDSQDETQDLHEIFRKRCALSALSAVYRSKAHVESLPWSEWCRCVLRRFDELDSLTADVLASVILELPQDDDLANELAHRLGSEAFLSKLGAAKLGELVSPHSKWKSSERMLTVSAYAVQRRGTHVIHVMRSLSKQTISSECAELFAALYPTESIEEQNALEMITKESLSNIRQTNSELVFENIQIIWLRCQARSPLTLVDSCKSLMYAPFFSWERFLNGREGNGPLCDVIYWLRSSPIADEFNIESRASSWNTVLETAVALLKRPEPRSISDRMIVAEWCISISASVGIAFCALPFSYASRSHIVSQNKLELPLISLQIPLQMLSNHHPRISSHVNSLLNTFTQLVECTKP